MKIKLTVLIFLLTFAISPLINAQIKLPGIFSNNMVMQRNSPVKIWGTADKKEPVEITFKGEKYKTRANSKGEWQVTLPAMSHGGPFTLEIKGKKNTITLQNIMIGDIWLCSGQSNMEWPVSFALNGKEEIKSADYPNIRLYNVPQKMEIVPMNNINAKWEPCSPETAGNFSAVAYFFARDIYRETGIPLGVINSSWGGTIIETWISSDAYAQVPENKKRDFDSQQIKDVMDFNKAGKGGIKEYQNSVLADKGLTEKWYNNNTATSAWDEMQIPGEWSNTPLAGTDGVVWFSYDIILPKDMAGKQARLSLGKIDDNDVTWVNSTEIGQTNGCNTDRIYTIPAEVLKPGKNNITVRITDETSYGGFTSEPQQLYIKTGDNEKVSLAGTWKYRTALTNKEFYKASIGPNSMPSILYNAMINPFIGFPIKGVIWYQGESNADNAHAYRTLFPSLIQNWRKKWGYDFPFYWVQLANFMAKDIEPSESQWAEVREAQSMTLSTPHTGQAVIIDIGEAGDIHPKNKQEVGRRLALIALNKDYGKTDIHYTGPTFSSMEKKGNKIIVTFDTQDSQLVIKNKYGYIEGFAIAGKDQKFVWAKATLKNGKVIVWSDDVIDPVAVRYGWGNNPDINLFDTEGLPAVPFRTDQWKGITESAN
ncbi:sialate O-acetylesterase [Coprobacter tertius]|nr:sialate O-acetylesterase [Coprobacter tertius]